jgi:DNA-binding HxlR family transcriptional regulator
MKRAGGTALALLSAPLNVHILRALETGPAGLLDLRRTAGLPPQSTMRIYLRDLLELEVLERRREESFPPSVEYSLTATGRALLKVGDVLQTWLNVAPEGSILLGSPAAKSATRALVEGWSTNIVRALAARPCSLTELSRLNLRTSYPALERRLGAMRLVNQVEAQSREGRGTPYRVTEWLRQAISPLVSATAWERKHLPGSTALIGRLDIEAAFLLAVPLMQLPASANGIVRLAVEVNGSTSAGALLRLESGKVRSCSVRLEGPADAFVAGTAMAWLRQMNGGPKPQVELGGDRQLGAIVTASLGEIALAARQPLESALQ